jgi:hypothetical protein
MKMGSIEKRHLIECNKLSGEFYFNSILQEAYTCGLLDESDLENIQLQCIRLLAHKSEQYNMGKSSSIRVEVAESIMKSNLYTIGLYLKSLPNPDIAADELKIKNADVFEMYERGRKILHTKFQTAKHLYHLVQKSKLDTINHSYNATLSENGIGIFFKAYNLDYGAYDCPASIDYQLCNPVDDLGGVEFIQKYLEQLYLENEFCKNFDAEHIHYLLYGYDKGYKDLLINIFEQVLTASLVCALADRNIRQLSIMQEDLRSLNEKLMKTEHHILMLNIHQKIEDIYEVLNITSSSLQKYIERSLLRIKSNIKNALELNTLDKVFIIPVNSNLEPKIQFESGVKMYDKAYRELVDELLACRYSFDKLKLIKQKVKSFDDLEDLLLDILLEEKEFISLFDTLGDTEIAAMIKRHPFESDIQAVDLSEAEQTVQLHLKNYVRQLPGYRQQLILNIANHLVWD